MDRTEAFRIARSGGWLAEQPDAFQRRVLERATVARFVPGQPVYHLGDGPGGVFCAVRGSFGAYVLIMDAGPVLAHVLRPVTWFGMGPLFRRAPRSMTFKAFENSVALHLPLPAINRIAAADPGAWRSFGELGYVTAERVIGAASDLLIRRADRRIAAVLHRLSRGHDAEPPVAELRLSQTELGEMANASRHLVNRTLSAFERRGWIATGYGRVAVRDAAALAAMAAGEIESEPWGPRSQPEEERAASLGPPGEAGDLEPPHPDDRDGPRPL